MTVKAALDWVGSFPREVANKSAAQVVCLSVLLCVSVSLCVCTYLCVCLCVYIFLHTLVPPSVSAVKPLV